MTKEEINTKASEFKIITDQKDEPDLETAQKFVGGPAILIKKDALKIWAS
jgi:hypothetical protein